MVGADGGGILYALRWVFESREAWDSFALYDPARTLTMQVDEKT